MEITSKSKLFDVLKAYPFLEDHIVHIAPPFQNLKNPVLRRTVGKLATLEQVAKVGGVDVHQLVNTLRKAAGQKELEADSEAKVVFEHQPSEGDPTWIAGEPQFIVNGTEMIERGEVPLTRVNGLLRQLESGRYLLLVTNFEPTPMLAEMQKQNRQVFHKLHPGDPGQHLTFIQ